MRERGGRDYSASSARGAGLSGRDAMGASDFAAFGLFFFLLGVRLGLWLSGRHFKVFDAAPRDKR